MTTNGTSVAATGRTTSNRSLCAVWDGTSGHLLQQLETSGNVLALTPDGSFLAAGNDLGEVAVWRVSDRRRLTDIPAGRNTILSLAFCRDFVRTPSYAAEEPHWLLAKGDSGGDVSIWEVPAQRLRTRCQGAQYDRTALAFSPDGTLLASGGRLTITFWDTATGDSVATVAWSDYLTGIAISDDGKRLAAACHQDVGRADASVFTLENGRGIHTLRGLSHPVRKVCFSANAHLVAAIADDWQVGIWDLSGDRLFYVLNMRRGIFTADNAGLAFSPDGSQFAFMAGTNALRLDVNSCALIRNWPILPGRTEELAFDPSGRLFAFHFESADAASEKLSRPTTVRIRELLSGGGIAEPFKLPEFNLDVRGAAWAPDASFVVVAGSSVKDGLTNRFLEAVSLAGNTHRWRVPQKLETGHPAAFALDAAGGFVTFVPGPLGEEVGSELLEADTGNKRWRLPLSPHALNSAGNLLAVRTVSAACGLHSFSDGSSLILLEPSGTKLALFPTFSLDGRFLAWGNTDGTASVCDLQEMRRRLRSLKLDW